MKIHDKNKKEHSGTTIFDQAKLEAAFFLFHNPHHLRNRILSSGVISYFTTGIVLRGLSSIITPTPPLIRIFTYPVKYFPVWIFLCLFFIYLSERYQRIFFKDASYDPERRLWYAMDGTYGNAGIMSNEERQALFFSAAIEENDLFILGTDINNREKLYSYRHEYELENGRNSYSPINPHKVVVGASKSGKSYCVVIPSIMQAIRRRESVVVTSPKGELYEATAAIAEKYGYTVRVINFNPQQIIHSDGVHFLKYATGDREDEIWERKVINPSTKVEEIKRVRKKHTVDDDVMNVHTFVNTIIANTVPPNSHRGDAFYEAGETALLEAVLLYIITSSDIPESEKTLGNAYNKILEYGINGIMERIGGLSITHPARKVAQEFMEASDNVKQSFYTGLTARLQVLAPKKVRDIVGHDDISLTEPGIKPCIYYVCMSDQERSMSFLVALFFSCLFQALAAKARTFPGETLPVKVNIIMDEFANCGVIQDMDEKLAVVRAFNIEIMYIIQNIGQLQGMYADKWETLLANTSTQIVLTAGDMTTSEYYSKLSGIQTVKTASENYQKNKGDFLHIHPQVRTVEGTGRRAVLNGDEIRRNGPDDLFLFVAGHNPVKLGKFPMDRHPMTKEMIPRRLSEYFPSWYEFEEMDETAPGGEDNGKIKVNLEVMKSDDGKENGYFRKKEYYKARKR